MAELSTNVADNSKTFFAAGTGALLLLGTGIKYMANAGENEHLIKMHRSKSTYQKDSKRMKTVIVPSEATGLPIEQRVPAHKKGEMYGTVSRGWRVGVPFIRSYRKVSLKQNNGRIDDFNVMHQTDPNLPPKKTLVQSHVNFAIVDEPYAMNRATFDFESPDELKQTVVSLCGSGLRYITKNMPEWALNDADVLTAGLEAVRKTQLLEKAGVELRSVQLNNFIISDAQLLSDGNVGPGPANFDKLAQTDTALDVATNLHIA